MPLKNLEERRKYHVEYRRKNHVRISTKMKERNSKRRREDPEKSPERLRNHRRKFRFLIFELLGNKCKRCGFSSDWRAFQIDHTNGGGGLEKKRLGIHSFQGKEYFEIVKASPEKYQILCCNCNQIKRYENGEGIGRKKDGKLL